VIPCVKGWLCNETLTYAAGGDDRRILLWDVQRVLSDTGLPAVMKGEHHSNIFCVAFNNSNTKIFSGGESAITLVLFAATLLQLRSASSGVLVVPCTRTSTGQRSFAVNGPRTWNSLPASLRSPDLSLRSFKRQLKSYHVPSLRVSGPRTTVWRHCDCTANLAPIINIQTSLPTYLPTSSDIIIIKDKISLL